MSKAAMLATLFIASIIAACSSYPTSASASTPPARNTQTLVPPTGTSFPPTPTVDLATILISIVEPRLFGSYPSPDGSWRVEVIIYDCAPIDPEQPRGNSLEQLFLVTEAGGKKTLLDSQLLNCGGLGASGLEGLFWTSSSSYFYYTGTREGVPDGCGFWQGLMDRINVSEKSTEYVGAGPVSPSGDLIATWVDHDLTLWKLDGPRFASITHPIPEAIPGPIAWSPTSEAVAYLLSEDYCPLGLTYLVIMDLDHLSPEIVLSSSSPSFANIAWEAPNRIVLEDEEAGHWAYNPALGTLLPKTK